jgi:RNAse (barnase) inhibitor barstar
MTLVDEITIGQVAPGIYRIRSKAQPETLATEFAAEGWRCFTLDAATWSDKAALLAAFQVAFALPAYFGHNWDALEEVLNDLAWAPAAGYVILIDHVAAFAADHPAEWETLFSILTEVTANWAKTDTPLYVLLRGARQYAECPWLH